MVKKMEVVSERSVGDDTIKIKTIDMNGTVSESPLSGLIEIMNGETDEDEHTFINYDRWLQESETVYYPTTNMKLVEKIPGGVYNIEFDRQRSTYFLNRITPILDDLLFLPDPNFDKIVSDLKFFWSNEELFKTYKYAYKRGLLLYGEPGCGKTSLTSLLSNVVANDFGGVVLSIRNSEDLIDYTNFIGKTFRMIEKNTPLLVIIEDLDGLLAYNENETALLNVLDGADQIHNVVYIASTNYPELLKERITNRPSRFDKRYYIGYPNETVRRYYFENKIKKEDLESKNISIDDLVKKTSKLSLAHLGEIVKMVFIFGETLEQTIKDLKDMGAYISSTNYEGASSKGIGFGNK
jgi:energy-coupling factor transporter ATP-binding protein EcfA2